MLLIVFGSNGYVWYRFWAMLPQRWGWWRSTLLVPAAIVALAPFLVIFLEKYFSTATAALLYTIGTSWLIAMVYLLPLFLLLDLLRSIPALHTARLLDSNPRFLVFLLLALAFLGIAGYRRYLDKERVLLRIPVQASFGTPMKLVMASDLHLGYTITPQELASWVRLINTEKPDLILLAGDIIDHQVPLLYAEGYDRQLRQLHAPSGIYAVYGNHEHYAGAAASSAFFKASGITLLCDSTVTIDGRLTLAGRDDRHNAHRQPLATLLGTVDHAHPVILLDHQLHDLQEVVHSGVRLYLSGHTHEGQIWPVSLLVNRMYELAHGIRQQGSTTLYVSSGLGIWGGKFRLGTRSEYVVIELLPVQPQSHRQQP